MSSRKNVHGQFALGDTNIPACVMDDIFYSIPIEKNEGNTGAFRCEEDGPGSLNEFEEKIFQFLKMYLRRLNG